MEGHAPSALQPRRSLSRQSPSPKLHGCFNAGDLQGGESDHFEAEGSKKINQTGHK